MFLLFYSNNYVLSDSKFLIKVSNLSKLDHYSSSISLRLAIIMKEIPTILITSFTSSSNYCQTIYWTTSAD